VAASGPRAARIGRRWRYALRSAALTGARAFPPARLNNFARGCDVDRSGLVAGVRLPRGLADATPRLSLARAAPVSVLTRLAGLSSQARSAPAERGPNSTSTAVRARARPPPSGAQPVGRASKQQALRFAAPSWLAARDAGAISTGLGPQRSHSCAPATSPPPERQATLAPSPATGAIDAGILSVRGSAGPQAEPRRPGGQGAIRPVGEGEKQQDSGPIRLAGEKGEQRGRAVRSTGHCVLAVGLRALWRRQGGAPAVCG